MIQQTNLREEITELGNLFGQTIHRIEGSEAYELVESFRLLARNDNAGDAETYDSLKDTIALLSESQLETIIRSFLIFLDTITLSSSSLVWSWNGNYISNYSKKMVKNS